MEIAAADWGWINYLRLAIYARVERELVSRSQRSDGNPRLSKLQETGTR